MAPVQRCSQISMDVSRMMKKDNRLLEMGPVSAAVWKFVRFGITPPQWRVDDDGDVGQSDLESHQQVQVMVLVMVVRLMMDGGGGQGP